MKRSQSQHGHFCEFQSDELFVILCAMKALDYSKGLIVPSLLNEPSGGVGQNEHPAFSHNMMNARLVHITTGNIPEEQQGRRKYLDPERYSPLRIGP
jgi:hypothetical protein